MQSFPRIPDVAAAPPSLFDGGHLWVQEWVVGAPLRFQLAESGLLRFGDDERTFDSGSVPVGYRGAVEQVRTNFDRERFRAAVEDVESVTFFGVATRFEGVTYDWERLPAFLGVFVWDEDREEYLPPDAVAQLFDRLGLEPVNAVEKEVRASDFDPGADAPPPSAWRDGPAAGVLVQNKTGDWAKLVAADPEITEFDGGAADAASEFAPAERLERTAAELGDSADIDAVVDAVVADVAREEYARVFDGNVAPGAFRSAVAERAGRVLGGE
jgi:hypothetical protein